MIKIFTNLFKKEKSIQKVEYDSCPCSGECCANPSTFMPKHKCKEEICESCFVSKCSNCGKSCTCDL